MTFKHIIIAATAFIACEGMSAQQISIIPQPSEIMFNENVFTLPDTISYFTVSSTNDSIANILDMFIPQFQKDTKTIFKPEAFGKACMRLACDNSLASEAYTLEISPGNILITASKPVGFFYALQTLNQLFKTSDKSLACVSIKDEPRFGWRGFMLDEGRHFFGKDEVKRVLDIMATYKMNRFHWHLTEDQGWRVEIKKYPKLTETGAFRSSKNLAWGDFPNDTVSYGGYYTQNDIREIVDYAKDRFIEIIPEIDIPGHSQAAIAAYPEILACDPENKHEVWLSQGVSRDVINVANPAAVKMANDIINELTELFPFGYLHLGGDECPVDKWKENKQCREQLASLGSENYRDLQLNFYKKLAAHLESQPAEKQRRLIFWNEVIHGNTSMLPDDIVIMAWVNADAEAKKAASQGFTTILSPQIPYYINRKQSTNPDEPLSQGRGTETLQAVYHYVPLNNVPDELHNKYIGVQANFWSEYVDTPEFLEYLMLPRLTAVAEAAWTPQEKREYTDFLKRIKQHKPLFRSNGWNFCEHEL